MSPSHTAMGPDARLLLVDGHSLAYRAFYALPVENFASPDGQPTNAIHGFISMLLQVVEAENPTHIAVAFDVSRDTFRRAEFPEYKANRAKSPVEFSGQVPVIREVLESFGIINLAVEGYEADDIIATLTTAASQQGAHVSILTGDRDSLQLVNDSITVLYPTKGVKDLARMTPNAVFDKFGVRPDQYADLAALRGDSSDNLPSIPGVGDKTAANWLGTYGDLNTLVSKADEIKGKVGENLRLHVSQVLLNRRLTQLVHTVPLSASVDELHRHLGNQKRIGDIFDRLGIRTLRNRAFAAFVSGTGEPVEEIVIDSPAIEVAWSRGKLAASLAQIPVSTTVAMAAAVRGLATIDALALAWDDNELVIEVADATQADIDAVHVFVADPDRVLVAHSAKPMLRGFFAAGVKAAALKFDTELLQYLLNPGLRGLDLESSVERLLHRPLSAQAQQDGLFDERPASIAGHAAAILAMYSVLESGAKEPHIAQLHSELEMPVMFLLAEMEYAGIAVDNAHLEKLAAKFEAKMQEAESHAHAVAGRQFNMGSPKQLQEVLFEDRKLPKTKKIKTGYTTDAEALQWLFDASGDEVVASILKWREVSKLRQTIQGLMPLVDAEGRIHTTFQQTVAATGRLSSIEPNLQNIPVRTSEGREIRKAFIAAPAYECLMTADYSQIEMRIMAHLSDDEG